MNIFLPYKSYLDDIILLISTLSILINLLFLRNAFLLTHCLSKLKAFCPIFIQCKEKKVFMLIFLLHDNFLGILLPFVYFLQIVFDICFFHALFFIFLFLGNSLYLFFVCSHKLSFLCS